MSSILIEPNISDISIHSFVILLLYCKKHLKNCSVALWRSGSDCCESLFSRLGAFYLSQRNYTLFSAHQMLSAMNYIEMSKVVKGIIVAQKHTKRNILHCKLNYGEDLTSIKVENIPSVDMFSELWEKGKHDALNELNGTLGIKCDVIVENPFVKSKNSAAINEYKDDNDGSETFDRTEVNEVACIDDMVRAQNPSNRLYRVDYEIRNNIKKSININALCAYLLHHENTELSNDRLKRVTQNADQIVDDADSDDSIRVGDIVICIVNSLGVKCYGAYIVSVLTTKLKTMLLRRHVNIRKEEQIKIRVIFFEKELSKDPCRLSKCMNDVKPESILFKCKVELCEDLYTVEDSFVERAKAVLLSQSNAECIDVTSEKAPIKIPVRANFLQRGAYEVMYLELWVRADTQVRLDMDYVFEEVSSVASINQLQQKTPMFGLNKTDPIPLSPYSSGAYVIRSQSCKALCWCLINGVYTNEGLHAISINSNISDTGYHGDCSKFMKDYEVNTDSINYEKIRCKCSMIDDWGFMVECTECNCWQHWERCYKMNQQQFNESYPEHVADYVCEFCNKQSE